MSDYMEVHVRIPKLLYSRLELLAKERGMARKWVVVSALEEFLTPKTEDRGDEVQRELYELKRRVSALRGDVEILAELLSYYIFNWIGYMPALDPVERAHTAREAKERHGRFLALFAKKVRKGDLTLFKLLAEELAEEESPLSSEPKE